MKVSFVCKKKKLNYCIEYSKKGNIRCFSLNKKKMTIVRNKIVLIKNEVKKPSCLVS